MLSMSRRARLTEMLLRCDVVLMSWDIEGTK